MLGTLVQEAMSLQQLQKVQLFLLDQLETVIKRGFKLRGTRPACKGRFSDFVFCTR